MKISDLQFAISAAINSEIESQRIHNIVREVVAKFNGKPVSKRIETALQKAQPGWVVHYSTQYGMFQLYVWGGDTRRHSDNRICFLIAYNSTPVISVDDFDRHNASTGSAAKSRNVGRDLLLSDTKRLGDVVRATNAVAEAKRALAGVLSELKDKEINQFETWEVEKMVEQALK